MHFDVVIVGAGLHATAEQLADTETSLKELPIWRTERFAPLTHPNVSYSTRAI